MNEPQDANLPSSLVWASVLGFSSVVAIPILNALLFIPGEVSHLRRILTLILCIDCALIVAFYPRIRASWSVKQRLGGVVVCCIVAVASWWFIPTNLGASLWSARSDSQTLQRQFRSLSPEDVETAASLFNSGMKLSAQFPHVNEVWESASHDWNREAVEYYLTGFAKTETGDFRSFKTQFAKRRRLQELWPETGLKLKTAEDDWLEQTVAQSIQQADQLTATQPRDAVLALRMLDINLGGIPVSDSLSDSISSARHRSMESYLDKLQEQARLLIESQSFPEAAALVTGIDSRLVDEASETGLDEELRDLQSGYSFLSRLSQVADSGDGQ